MKPVERILTNGGGLFEERGGRVLVKGTDVDLAEVWERTTEAAQEFSVSALHWALHSRGISLNLAQVLVDFVLKHPVTVEDYYLHVEAEDDAAAAVTPSWDAIAKAVKEGKAETVTTVTGDVETTVYRVPDADLLDSTKPHWSLDQSLQEARDHINILHKEVSDLKQHVARSPTTAEGWYAMNNQQFFDKFNRFLNTAPTELTPDFMAEVVSKYAAIFALCSAGMAVDDDRIGIVNSKIKARWGQEVLTLVKTTAQRVYFDDVATQLRYPDFEALLQSLIAHDEAQNGQQ